MLKKNIKVLLIENNKLDAYLVQEMLAQEKNIKFKLKFVNCLSNGLKRLAKGGIDVVLLDFSLQKNKGISALSKIHTQAPQVAIVVQTILTDKSTAIKALQEGAQDYLIKDSLNSDLLVRSLSYSVEKKNIENMLRESEEKFKKLEESANKPIILIGLKGKLLSLNNCAASNLGGKPKDYITKTLWDIFPKKVADERFKDHQKAIQSGRSNVKEITVSFKGIEYYYLSRIQPIRNKLGDINSVLILDNDITDRKKTEKYLVELEEKYHIVFENTGTATMIIKEDRTISIINTQCEKLSGYSKKEIENKMKWTDFVIPEDLKRMKKYHITRKKAGEKPPTEYEFRMTDKKGNVKDIFLKIGMIPDTKKSIASFIDITERKQAEKVIQESESRFREMFNHISTGVAIYEAKNNGRDFIIKDFNRAAEKIEKVKKEDIIGKSVLRVFPGVKDFGLFKVFQEVYKTGKPQHHPISFYQDQRVTSWRENYVCKLPTGEVAAIYDDITERKQAEEKIKHLNLVLRAIRRVNQLIVREKDREKLLKSACKNLIKTRGYHNTWIELLDEEGKLKTCAEAGLGKDFLPMIELLKRGKLTTCSQKALKQQEVVIIENPASTCSECPLAQKYSGRGAMSIRLEYSGKVYGFMTVSIPAHLAVDQEEQSLFKEIAEDIASCLYNIELDEERKQAEENLKNAKDELQMILDSVPAIIFYKDIESRVIRANKTLANSLKMPVKDIVGKTTEELFPKEQAEKMRKDDKEVMISGKSKRNIIQPYDTPEGVKWAVTDKIPYKDKEGKITGVISLSKDITLQKKSEEELQQSYQRLKKTMDAAIDTMSKIIEAKDPYTAGHQHRVCQLAVPLARELGLSEDKIEGIRIASLIHDIGKIGLPTEILSKPTTLTDIEFNIIKEHSQIGYDILKSIDFPYPVAQIVLQHHDRLDGSGYPSNLKGDKILLEAKIIGVADVVEAMSSHRPYRPALGIEKALEEISQNKGILYDSEVVDTCIRLFKEKGFKFE